jgi:tetrahydromethanopterin S-methyltransferase subunit F
MSPHNPKYEQEALTTYIETVREYAELVARLAKLDSGGDEFKQVRERVETARQRSNDAYHQWQSRRKPAKSAGFHFGAAR